MNTEMIYVTQRKLRNLDQLPFMMEAIVAGDPLPPVILAELEDGTIEIRDGHHRVTAHWLLQAELKDYILLQLDVGRPRFGKIADLVNRVSSVNNAWT